MELPTVIFAVFFIVASTTVSPAESVVTPRFKQFKDIVREYIALNVWEAESYGLTLKSMDSMVNTIGDFQTECEKHWVKMMNVHLKITQITEPTEKSLRQAAGAEGCEIQHEKSARNVIRELAFNTLTDMNIVMFDKFSQLIVKYGDADKVEQQKKLGKIMFRFDPISVYESLRAFEEFRFFNANGAQEKDVFNVLVAKINAYKPPTSSLASMKCTKENFDISFKRIQSCLKIEK